MSETILPPSQWPYGYIPSVDEWRDAFKNIGVAGPASSIIGDIAAFGGTDGQSIVDTGIVAANLVQGPASVVSGHLAGFNGTSGKLLQDTGVSASGLMNGPGASVAGHIATFNGTSGQLLADSGIAASALVNGPSTSVAGDLVVFADNMGATLHDSGVQLASLAVGPNSSIVGDIVIFGNSSGGQLNDSGVQLGSLAIGPSSAVDSNLLAFNGTTGGSFKDSLGSWSKPLQIGGTTPNSGAFTSLAARNHNVTGDQTVSFNPVGGSGLQTLGSMRVTGTTLSNTEREFLTSFELTSNNGIGASGSNSDKVALYAGSIATNGSGTIWGANITATISAGTVLNGSKPAACGVEVDIGNFVQNTGATAGGTGIGFPNIMGLLVACGTVPYSSTAAICVSASQNNPSWYRGVSVVAAVESAFSEYSSATNGMDIWGAHAVGINMSIAGITGGAIQIPNGTAIVSNKASGPASTYQLVSSGPGNNTVVGFGGTFCTMMAATVPGGDNLYQLGAATARWTSVWATTGSIQTSDPSLKTDIAPLPPMLEVVKALEPKTYKWISGGFDEVETQEVQTVQDTELLEYEEDEINVIGGKAVAKKVKRSHLMPAYDDVPVHDEAGNPICDEVKDKDGNPTGQIAYRLHRIPRMVTKEVTVTKRVERPGKRTHWGFMAPDVRDAFAKTGVDFAGYVKAEEGSHHLRPDQLIPVLWKSTQELIAMVEALKAEVVELKAAKGNNP